jgi:hypothetical protein
MKILNRFLTGLGSPGLQHVDNAFGQALVSQDDAELGRLRDLFQDLQLAQAHEDRVVLEQLGGGLLAADDQVGLAERRRPGGFCQW